MQKARSINRSSKKKRKTWDINTNALAYRKAIQIKPDFVLAHFFLGLMYLDVRDRNRALEEYRILKDLDPDYANDLLNMIR